MKYYNLVFCKHHPEDRRAYVYQLPMEADVTAGQKLYVSDRQGEHTVTVYRDNFFCGATLAKAICEAMGGYFPPAEVVGTIGEVVIRQEVVNRFPGKEELPY